MRAFRAKAPLDAMLAAMPVKVILNAEAGLLGAAVFAAQRQIDSYTNFYMRYSVRPPDTNVSE